MQTLVTARATDARARAARVATVAAAAADSVDVEARFPAEAVAAMKAERMLSALIPPSLGGYGWSITDVAETCTTLGASCSAAAMVFAMHQIQVACIVRHARDSKYFACATRRDGRHPGARRVDHVRDRSRRRRAQLRLRDRHAGRQDHRRKKGAGRIIRRARRCISPDGSSRCRCAAERSGAGHARARRRPARSDRWMEHARIPRNLQPRLRCAGERAPRTRSYPHRSPRSRARRCYRSLI